MSASMETARHTAFVADQNPTIKKAGTAEFGASRFCLWETVNGQISTVTIANTGKNVLQVSISGAPPEIVTKSGKPLNGVWDIPPNNPTASVVAPGDYLGQKVTIFNISNPGTTCKVTAVVAT